MKKLNLVVLILLFCFSAYSQKIEYKFGKVSKEELEQDTPLVTKLLKL